MTFKGQTAIRCNIWRRVFDRAAGFSAGFSRRMRSFTGPAEKPAAGRIACPTLLRRSRAVLHSGPQLFLLLGNDVPVETSLSSPPGVHFQFPAPRRIADQIL